MKNSKIDFAYGGEPALEAVVEKYGHPILRYCHSILCDYHEAQDAVQMTFIKAYQKRASFDSGKSLSAWLYRIAYNTCIDIIRRRALRLAAAADEPQAEDNLIPENIKSALLSLSHLDRSLVYARVMEQRTYDDLAEIHGKTPQALRKRYERAKKRLAVLLADDYPSYAKKSPLESKAVKEKTT